MNGNQIQLILEFIQKNQTLIIALAAMLFCGYFLYVVSMVIEKL